MKKTDKNHIVNGHISKTMLSLALPTMLGMLMHNVFNIVDMYFVGKLGHTELAAVSLSGLFIQLIYTFALGLSTGTVALVSRFIGNNEDENAAEVGKQSLYLAVIIFIFVATGANLALEPILNFLGAEPEVLPHARIYNTIILSFSIVVFIPMAFNAFLRGTGDTVTPMKAMMIAAGTNIILDPIMIFGYFGFPALGVAGSAVATITARFLGLLFLFYMVTRGKREITISVLPIKLDFNMMYRIIKVGVYSSFQHFLRNISNMVMMKYVAYFGTAAIAAYGVGLKIRIGTILPVMGLGVAAATMVGQNLGAKKSHRSEKAAWLAVFYGELLMLIGVLIFWFYSKPIISFFNDHPEVVKSGMIQFKYVAISLIFMSLAIILERALGGAGETLVPMLASVLALYLIRLPASYYLMQKYEIEGVWMGILASAFIQSLILILYFRSNRWKKKEV
ncbi:MAG: MATE family efflux transporter [Vulcanimicrobiota bacterium]